jgi:hypothetical protein
MSEQFYLAYRDLTEDERQQIAMDGFAHLVSFGAIKPNKGAQQ